MNLSILRSLLLYVTRTCTSSCSLQIIVGLLGEFASQFIQVASLRQTTDFTPGYIAEISCREELLDLAGRRLPNSCVIFRREVESHQPCQRTRIVLDRQ
jgi:hypothetical protein